MAKASRETHYLKRQDEIYQRLGSLPKGTIKERLISGRKYFYLQHREGKKVWHTYIGKVIPKELKAQLNERWKLRQELEKIQTILRSFFVQKLKKGLF